jgi:Patatin-like phospholipase
MSFEGSSEQEKQNALTDWKALLESCNDRPNKIVLFSDAFVNRWKAVDVNDDDRLAAAKLHIQLVSRITTQRLPYVDGEEVTALTSVFKLFDQAREIFKSHPRSSVTDAVVWHVMNNHVRPFTAKWHRQSEHGALTALDATDIFRHELAVLQRYLVRFDALLMAIRDRADKAMVTEPGTTDREARIVDEMDGSIAWGIDGKLGGLKADIAGAINDAEKTAVLSRRKHYRNRFDPNAPEETPEEALKRQPFATGLAISGGGIRSATFGLGVLAALARRNLLYQFDYLSTVSGGGYLGSFLTTFLSAPDSSAKSGSSADGAPPAQRVEIGLCRSDLPFKRDEGEAAALRHVRHHSKYLATGRLWERLQMAFAQVYGMAMNGLGFAWLAFVAAFAEFLIRRIPGPDWRTGVAVLAIVLLSTPFLVPLIRRRNPASAWPDRIVAGPFVLLLGLLAWHGLGLLHDCLRRPEYLILFAAVPLLASAILALAGNLPAPVRGVLIVLSVIAAPLLFLGIELAAFCFIAGAGFGIFIAIVVTVAGLLLFWWLFDINSTSPHRLYKKKLGEAYLVQPGENVGAPMRENVSVKLSACDPLARAPYHLVNCALNVPGSQNSQMQGRLTDFFLFSKAFCGSPLTGYRATGDWESLDGTLDLGTAMAISGAAAAPQMGLGTIKNLSFWLALFNVRLGYWIRNPLTKPGRTVPPPGLTYLLDEMFGWANEERAYINVSDGGHIENLGVYELLRRRCKYIVAIDGEQDEKMTFQGLTTLLRLAYIDFGIRIDVGLDALRLATSGFSYSHFVFCRIHYPKGQRDGPDEDYGYLLYVKLSLTGNEGEFLRRYKLDEPAFPHTSTGNQFFTEAQFEAYRSLGEHVGDKMFLPAIVGDEMAAPKADVVIESWFAEIGKNMLDPLPPKESSPPAAKHG